MPTTQDIVVLFAQLPAGSNWGADPRAQKASGTLTINGSQWQPCAPPHRRSRWGRVDSG